MYVCVHLKLGAGRCALIRVVTTVWMYADVVSLLVMSDGNLESLSDEEIRAILVRHGVSDIPPLTATTRPFLLRKIAKLTSNQENESFEDKQSSSSPSTNHVNPEEVFSEPSDGYFAVVLEAPVDREGLESSISSFYSSKSEALKAIRNISGARFRKFSSKDGAEEFSREQRTRLEGQLVKEVDRKELQEKSSGTAAALSEKANNFPSLKQQDLNKFRKLIESGDFAAFNDTVWTNPRHLISSGDSPVILKPPTWYNAVHCAVLSGQLEICKEIFAILQSDRFWEMVYPDDSEETRSTRREHLVDLYLNMQDKLNCEAPLHFASKLGHVDIVSFLLSFPNVSLTVQNKYHQTPVEVVCRNARNSSAATKKRIEELFREPEIYYVPVLRTVDNTSPPHLSNPCTLQELTAQSPSFDTTGSSLIGHALAGPMSPSMAEDFYKEWRSPLDSVERKDASAIKRSDPDRGLERVGRQLAHKRDVGWVEYWDFLGYSCDLSKVEGRQMLEEYLSNLMECPSQLMDTTASPGNTSISTTGEEDPLVIESGDAIRLPDLNAIVTRDLFVEKEGDLDVGVAQSSHGVNTDNSSCSFDSIAELLDEKLTLDASVKTESNFHTPLREKEQRKVFLSGPLPTKLDYDVMLALGEEPDWCDFPFIQKWLNLVKSYSEQEQRSWRTPNSTKRQYPFRTNFVHPVSRLIYSSPSHPHHVSPLIHNTSPSRNVTRTPTRQQHQHQHQAHTPVRYYHSVGNTPNTQRGGYRPTSTATVATTNTTPHRQSPLHSSLYDRKTGTNTRSVQGSLLSKF